MLFIEKIAQDQAVASETSAKVFAPLEGYVIKNISENMSLDDMAQTLGISKFALTRLFHKHYGMAPMRWLWSFRAHLAKDIISKGLGLQLMDILTLCGFNSPQHFSRFFRKTFRQAPSRLMKEMGLDRVDPNLDVAKAKQELYDMFEATVTSSLALYVEKCRIVRPEAKAEEAEVEAAPALEPSLA